jgi:hypothetical protein
MPPAYVGGGSLEIKDDYVRQQIARVQPRTVVDFGAGLGKMGELCREVLGPEPHLTAVEGCAKTITPLREKGIYDRIDVAFLQDWIRANSARFDLAIFGDVLEHLTRREALRSLDRMLLFAHNVIVTVPLRNLHQDGNEVNPLEEHKAYFTERCFDRRYLIREKHLVTPDPGYVVLNCWLTGRKRFRLKGFLKDRLLLYFGRRGKAWLERLGYDGYPPADA